MDKKYSKDEVDVMLSTLTDTVKNLVELQKKSFAEIEALKDRMNKLQESYIRFLKSFSGNKA